MPMWVGDAGGVPRLVTDPRVGDGGVQAVSKVWVGDAGGVPRLVYTRASAITLSATTPNWSRTDLSWTGGSAPFTLKRGSTTLYSGSGTFYSDTGLPEGTTYTYTVSDGYGNSDSITPLRPIRPTTQKTVTLNVKASGSYDGDLDLRSTSSRYFGYYSSTWGVQSSVACFAIPGDVAGCVSVDKVELSWYVDHTYLGGGTTVALGLNWTDFTSAPSTRPTISTLRKRGGSDVYTASAPKGGYVGGSTWHDIDARVVGGGSIFQEFRDNDARGLALIAAGAGQNYYGYGNNAPRLRLTYTVYQ